eukprot:jgi/Bigna1/77795/fgenesh1_pg.50_\
MTAMHFLPLVLLFGFSGHVLGDEHEEHPTIHGSGTTNPSPFFWKVMDLFEERARQDIRMTYRAVGSSTGQREFQGENNGNVAYTDFGAGDIPMTQARYNNVTGAGGRVMVHIPFVIGGVSIFYNIPAADLGGQPLDLDACALAGIFNGNYTTWDHPAILALNPSLSVPAGSPITVFHRIRGSSSTTGVTKYLEQRTSAAEDNCPQLWTHGSGSTINWPTTSGFQPRSGSGGVSSGISSTDYSIGYIDSGFGHRLGLQEIKLKNRAGRFLDSKEADLGAAATAALSQTPAQGGLPSIATQSFAQVSLLDKEGTNTWPITLMSYMYVEQNLTLKEQNGQLLKSFIEFVLSDDGQTIAEEFSFVRVPASIGSSTQMGLGAQEFAISEKRQSFADYDRGLIYTQLTALTTRVAATEAASSQSCSCKEDDDSDVKGVANVGTVFGVLAFIISIIVAIKVFCFMPAAPASAPKIVERENSSVSMGATPSQVEIKASQKV